MLVVLGLFGGLAIIGGAFALIRDRKAAQSGYTKLNIKH
jgi:hypothetical protein